MEPDPRRIIEVLQSAGRPLRPRDIAAALGLGAAATADLRSLLEELDEQGILLRLDRGRYMAPEQVTLAAGRLQATRGGATFLIPDDRSGDIFVPPESTGTALHGDRVVVRLQKRQRAGRPEGAVVQVTERARDTIVGTYRAVRPGGSTRARRGIVEPEDSRIRRSILLQPSDGPAPEDGEVVVVRITDWGEDGRGPRGVIAEVLGAPGAPGVDVLTIIHRHELPIWFPPAVEAAALARDAEGVTAEDITGREDLRDVATFTIDPADARDHDDALSAEPLPDGGCRVGIHIADVSHYVRPGDPLDREALARGTSVYLVDRVIPMLPHALSSSLCSLTAGDDRLTLSLLVDLDADARVTSHRLVRAVIRSRHRLSYAQAQAVLDGVQTVEPVVDSQLTLLGDVARKLRLQRQDRGSLDFDVPETQVILDEDGAPVDIRQRERGESHRIVEDLMLLANETIASRAALAKVPFIYRIHESPDPARLEQLATFMASLGLRLGPGGGRVPGPRDLQAALAAADARPDAALVRSVVLRMMKQARYSAPNPGHFGLAAPRYTHFTSPIRRYPDLVVHRLAAALFIDHQPPRMTEEQLEEIARACSERERVAAAAERDSVELKKVAYMERHLGETFDATISSVTGFGFFALLDDVFIEGLVHVSSLDDDFYTWVEDQYALAGERTGRRFRIGDRVSVRVDAVDRDERRISFELLGTRGLPGGRRARSH